MSTAGAQTASALDEYLGLFDALAGLGVEFVVIGGCAVGAYARLLGETVFSNDLDLFLTPGSVERILHECSALGLRIDSVAPPRSVPVTVLTWNKREVNLLTSSDGFAAPDVEARSAREFRLSDISETTILIADPFDLLRNKLAINRAKDQPHIEVLRRFIDAEVVHGFLHEADPRARIGAAERLLEVLDANVLDEALANRLVPLARQGADFRFLAHRAPTATLVAELTSRAPTPELREAVLRIAAKRGFVP